MKKLLILAAVVFLGSAVSGQVTYSIDAGVDQAEINTTAVVECNEDSSSCPVNSWSLQWNIPENSVVRNISDSQGEVDSYERTGDVLEILTNTGPPRTSEKIHIDIVDGSNAEEITDNFYRRSISLSGFSGKSNSGEASADSLLSSRITRDFRKSYDDNSVVFSGSGAGNIRLNFGNGAEKQYYSFFGTERNGSLAYRVAVGTTGLRQSYRLIPVAVLDRDEYNDQVFSWSEGEYGSGVIKLRQGLGEDFQPVLAEETVHAFNDDALSFDSSSSTWLDEGLAGYVQSMVRRSLEGAERSRTLFGDETSYTIRENGSRYRITKPSKGDREVLWNYYDENRSFMRHWSPGEVEPDVRSFGYAYSELIVKNSVSNNNSIRELYRDIETDEKLESNEEKWSYYSQYLDLTPCRFEDRERFDRCLDRVNSYDYRVLSASEMPEVQGEEVTVEELETPNYTERGLNAVDSTFRNRELFEESWANSVKVFFQNVVGKLKQFSF